MCRHSLKEGPFSENVGLNSSGCRLSDCAGRMLRLGTTLAATRFVFLFFCLGWVAAHLRRGSGPAGALPFGVDLGLPARSEVHGAGGACG